MSVLPNSIYDDVVIVKKKTDYEMLCLRYASASNVRSAFMSRNADVGATQKMSEVYYSNAVIAQKSISKKVASQPRTIDYTEVPLFPWSRNQIVVLIGPDGLFVNVAKYIYKLGLPVICINPNPEQVSGVIMKHKPQDLGRLIALVKEQKCTIKPVTLAVATTNDKQDSLYAVNDFLVGRLDQRSSRYKINFANQIEHHSSSGILVSTPMGKSGWLSSCIGADNSWLPPRGNWNDNHLVFWVREPFVSVNTETDIRYGTIDSHTIRKLSVESEMPEGGVVVSDGMFDNCIEFNSGTTVSFNVAPEKINYVD